MNDRKVAHKEFGFNAHAMALLAGLFCVLSCFFLFAPAHVQAGSATVYTDGVPGGVIVNTVEVNAKVMDLDKEKRIITLQDSDGKMFTAKAGPKAVNFDQVSVGDMVNITVTEELVVYLDEEGVSAAEVSSGVVSTAPKGELPGGFAASTNQITGTVTAIDLKEHTATLEFKDGGTKTFPVRKDVDLTKRKVGEKVVFRLTEKIAVSVEKP